MKILHPHVHELFHVDLQLLATAARCLHAIPTLAWLHLPEEIAYFSRAMQQQLDLRPLLHTDAVLANLAHLLPVQISARTPYWITVLPL